MGGGSQLDPELCECQIGSGPTKSLGNWIQIPNTAFYQEYMKYYWFSQWDLYFLIQKANKICSKVCTLYNACYK
jgi:hypothetical protein